MVMATIKMLNTFSASLHVTMAIWNDYLLYLNLGLVTRKLDCLKNSNVGWFEFTRCQKISLMDSENADSVS